MIVILSHPGDLHARAVRRELSGERVEIVDTGALGAGDHLTFHEGRRLAAVWTRASGEEIDLLAARAIWDRRMSTPRVPECAERELAIRQWDALVLGTLEALPVRMVNPPLLDRYLHKPFQLAQARRVGLRVPETAITSRADVARAFVRERGGEVVHKPLGGSRSRMLATRRFDGASAEALGALRLAPEIFQEAVSGGRELRVTVVGARIFAAEFRPQSVDGRLDEDAEYRPHLLPATVELQVHALMARLGLHYAAIDMKLTDEGDHVFLELNPQGQFLYVEILTGMPIAAAMAALLAEKDGRSCGRPT